MWKQLSFLLGFLVALVGVSIVTDPQLWSIGSLAIGLLLLAAGMALISAALAKPYHPRPAH